MTCTAHLKAQHEACLAIVDDIKLRSVQIPDRPSAVEISLMLARLTGILRIHLALEDEIIYPALRNSPDPQMGAIGQRYWDEMGGLADTFLDFVDRWKRADAVLANPDGFRSESADVFKALEERIAREDREVYPLAERTRISRAA